MSTQQHDRAHITSTACKNPEKCDKYIHDTHCKIVAQFNAECPRKNDAVGILSVICLSIKKLRKQVRDIRKEIPLRDSGARDTDAYECIVDKMMTTIADLVNSELARIQTEADTWIICYHAATGT